MKVGGNGGNGGKLSVLLFLVAVGGKFRAQLQVQNQGKVTKDRSGWLLLS
jgi:hypothetical protein